MLQQCGHYSSTHGRQCSCGLLCGGGGPAAFSIFLPMTGSKFSSVHDDEVLDFDKSDASSSVDCTLSLGLPSTRLTEHKAFGSSATSQSTPSCLSSPRYRFPSHSKKPDPMPPVVAPASCAGANTIGTNLGSDPLLLARRCANCDTTSTPLWRNGPRGPKSLCNACGIRYKKEERRAAATAASPSSSGAPAAAEQAIGYGYYRSAPAQPSPWSSCYASAADKGSPSISMYEVEATDEGDVPFLAWRLNLVPPTQFPAVRNRPSLFGYSNTTSS